MVADFTEKALFVLFGDTTLDYVCFLAVRAIDLFWKTQRLKRLRWFVVSLDRARLSRVGEDLPYELCFGCFW